jgi:hypothetical protein
VVSYKQHENDQQLKELIFDENNAKVFWKEKTTNKQTKKQTNKQTNKQKCT